MAQSYRGDLTGLIVCAIMVGLAVLFAAIIGRYVC